MSVSDGFVYYFDSANYAGGHRYIDLRSLWVAPEYPEKGGFQFRLECQAYENGRDKAKTWNVPALANGQMYKIVVPSDWMHLWRCKAGALNAQQVIMDDIEYCLWDFPYAVPIPW